MAGEWRTMPLDQAVEVDPPVQLRPGQVYPFVDMQAVNPSSRDVRPSEYREFSGGESRFQNDDTLMARITPCPENGTIARFRNSDDQPFGHGSTEFIVIRGRNGVTDNDFAYYLIRSDLVRTHAVTQMRNTSGRQRVPVDSLHHLQVRVPPLPEERAITHILGTLGDKVELNRRMSETLEQDGAGAFQGVVRGLRARARQDGGPVEARPVLARPAPTSTTSSPTAWWTPKSAPSRRGGRWAGWATLPSRHATT